MRLCDIPVNDVQQGKNWRFVEPPTSETMQEPLTDWGPIIECVDFDSQDLVVYSGLVMFSDGEVVPTICVKEVGDLDFGGDYCVFIGGNWRVLGPNLGFDAEIREEFFANPLENDPSFNSADHDYREWHRTGFREHSDQL